MEVLWTHGQLSSLIELYHHHSILWDAANRDYKDKSKKNDAWADIAERLNMSQREVETKMHILRSQFSREKKKLRRTGEEAVKSKWHWYEPLQFLLRGASRSSSTDTMGALPELWQTSNLYYKNRAKKSAAIDVLAKRFNTTPFEIHRKWHNLRTQFNNELRKVKEKKEIGENYMSTWKYFTSLNFLMPFTVQASDTQANVKVTSTNNDSLKVRKPSTSTQPHRTPAKRPTDDEGPDQRCKSPKTTAPSDKSDDAAVFGDFVAAAARNMRSDARRRELKRKIQRVILDMEELDESDHSSVPSSNTSQNLKYEILY